MAWNCIVGLLLLPAVSGLAWQPPACLERPAKLLLHLITDDNQSPTDACYEEAMSPSENAQLQTQAALMQRTEGLLMSMGDGPEGGNDVHAHTDLAALGCRKLPTTKPDPFADPHIRTCGVDLAIY